MYLCSQDSLGKSSILDTHSVPRKLEGLVILSSGGGGEVGDGGGPHRLKEAQDTGVWTLFRCYLSKNCVCVWGKLDQNFDDIKVIFLFSYFLGPIMK